MPASSSEAESDNGYCCGWCERSQKTVEVTERATTWPLCVSSQRYVPYYSLTVASNYVFWPLTTKWDLQLPLFTTLYIALVHSFSSLPLPKRVLHTGWSRNSSFSFQYLFVSLRSSSSCLRLLHRLPVHFHPSFNTVFQKAVPTQHVTSPVGLPLFYCSKMFISSLNLRHTPSFSKISVKLTFSILPRHRPSKLARYILLA